MAEKLVNGTFEAWNDEGTQPDNWAVVEGGSSTITREDSIVFSGNHSCKFDVDASNSWVWMRAFPAFSLTPGEQYYFSYRYWNSEVDKTAMFYICALGGGQNCLQADGTWDWYADYQTIPNSYQAWGTGGILFTAHPSYPLHSIWLYRNDATSSQIYFDNFSIDDSVDHVTESSGIILTDTRGVHDSVSVKDDFKYYLASSAGKVFEYSGDYLSDDGSVIVCRWRSKTLTFADQIPKCHNAFKTVYRVKLVYKDLTSATDVTVYVSTDGGATWEHETKSLGTGSGVILSANYHFIKTGEYFVIAIEHVSTDKDFLWLRMEVDVEPLGAYTEIS